MGNKLYDEGSIQSIADAIRMKNGENTLYKVSDMASAIKNISTTEDTITSMGFNNKFPDKYNCGCKIAEEDMLIIDATSSEGMNEFSDKYPDLASIFTYRTSDSATKPYWLQLEFKSWNTSELQETYVIEGVDFTNFIEVTTGHKEPVSPVTIIFRNCKFPHWYSGYPLEKPDVWFVFEYCTFVETLSGGGYDFEWCFIENKYGDGMNPGSFVHGKNFYIHNYIAPGSDGTHVDGIQIFGDQNNSENIIHDVSFENYRCELIPLKWSNSTSAVNDPIMVQVEFSGCNDISFNHCYINGGASSVDISNKGGDLPVNDVRVTDVQVGGLRIYTVIKQSFDSLFNNFSYLTNIELSNIRETVQAYCGSVWKDETNPYNIHLSLTNHTNQDRKIVAITEDGVAELSIGRCMTYSEIVEDVTTLEDFPFDVDVVVSTNGTSFINVFDAGENEIQTGRNLIPLKKLKFDDMVKVESIEYPFETFTDGSSIYYDLLDNQTLTPINANYKLKYSSTDENVAEVVNDYIIVRGIGDCVITVFAGNYYKKEIPVSITEITYEKPSPTFHGSYYGTSDFALTGESPYFIACVKSNKKILINSPEIRTCNSSTQDRLSVTTGDCLYTYNEETETWDLTTTYSEDTIINGIEKFENSTFIYCNYNICSPYGKVFFNKNYDQLSVEASRMR